MTKDNHLLGNFDLNGIPRAARGVPQIQVTFDMDENGILNVSAEDQGTGNTESITITNDQGRLSKEEIDQMISDAEKFSEEDKLIKEKVDARNSLDSYLHSMRNTIEDKEKLADKLEEDDKETINEALQEHQEWIDTNPDADREDYEDHLKELQGVCDPIISKVYQENYDDAGDEDEDEDIDDL